MAALKPLAKLAPLGEFQSFARPAIDCDRLVAELTEQAKAQLAAADEKLTADEASFEGALAYVEAKRIFGPAANLEVRTGRRFAEIRPRPAATPR